MKRAAMLLVIPFILLLSSCKAVQQDTPTFEPSPQPAVSSEPSVQPEQPTAGPEVQSDVTPEAEPEETYDSIVDEAFNALRENRRDDVERYMSYEHITGTGGIEVTDDNDKRFNDALFGRLSWKLGDSKLIDTDSAQVSAEISTVDMDAVVSQYLVDVTALYAEFNDMPENDKYTDEQMEQKVFELLLQILEKTPESITSEVEVGLHRESGGDWRIVLDEALTDALTGNFNKAVGGG